ncbi:hypothetical protein Tco_0169569 [Tanacetum coccineum]
MYYCAPNKDLSKHFKALRNDAKLANFIKLTFENGCKVDLCVQHHGYDVIADGVNSSDEEVDDEQYEIDMEDIAEYVGPQHIGEEDVIIPNIHVIGSFLNKLVIGNYIMDQDVGATLGRNSNSLREDELEDKDVDDRFKVKEVNDYKSIVVLHGRSVKERRCSRKKGKHKVDGGKQSKSKGKQKVDEDKVVSKVDRLEYAYIVYPILPAIPNQSQIIWEVEFFKGWKPLSPLQLAMEEVMSE